MGNAPSPTKPIRVVATVLAVVGALVAGTVVAPAAAAAAPRPVLYLTFDDGPGEDTPAFLDLLARHDITATFFMTGRAVSLNPDTAVRVAAAGHAVANHSWSHPRLTSLSDAGIRSELARTNSIIAATIGATPVCYRPPYGATNARVHAQAVAVGLPNAGWTTGAGSHLGLWDVDTNDWRLSTNSGGWTESAMRSRLDGAVDGDTILLHDGYSNRRRGLAVLAGWLADNRDRFEFRPLPGCGGRPPVEPVVDPDRPESWHRARIARLYLAYLGRLPDDEGFEYWNRQYTLGASMADISWSFAVGAEFEGLGMERDEDFVDHLYRQVLGREPEPAGRAYWLDQLAGGTDRGALVLFFSDGPEFVRRSAPTITGACYEGDPIPAWRCWADGQAPYAW